MTEFDAKMKLGNRRRYARVYCGRQAGSAPECGGLLGIVDNSGLYAPQGHHFEAQEDGVLIVRPGLGRRSHHGNKTYRAYGLPELSRRGWGWSGAVPERPATLICPKCGARNRVP